MCKSTETQANTTFFTSSSTSPYKNDNISTERQTPTYTNQKWILARRPTGPFDPQTDAQLITELNLPLRCPPDSIIVETHVLSVDAFLRTMMDEEAYHGSIPLGGTIPALGYGMVICVGKDVRQFKVRKMVQGMLGAQTHAVVKANQVVTKFNIPFLSPTASLGLVGLTTGLTAYTGMYYVCRRPRKGETAVVTGAAGAVGSIACQLAKATGARVIGIAGGEKKKSYLLEDIQIDGAVDYKHPTMSMKDQLDVCCPDGVDFVYDNVGGETLDHLLNNINPKGRVVICGAISQYSGKLNKGLVQGPSNYLKLAERGAEMKGFNVMQYISKSLYAVMGMVWMYWRGKVVMREHVEEGIGSFPGALGKLFAGGHIGKMLVNVKTS